MPRDTHYRRAAATITVTIPTSEGWQEGTHFFFLEWCFSILAEASLVHWWLYRMSGRGVAILPMSPVECRPIYRTSYNIYLFCGVKKKSRNIVFSSLSLT